MVEAMMVILVAGSVGVGALLVSAFANPNGELDASSAFLRLVVLWMSAIGCGLSSITSPRFTDFQSRPRRYGWSESRITA